MSDEQWIVIPNWDKFQHYKDRQPTWIKLYLELRDRGNWGNLSYAQRGLLVSIWIEYGATGGILPASEIPQRCRQKTRRDSIDSLVQAGFITLSSRRPLAHRYQREVLRTSKEGASTKNGASPSQEDEFPAVPTEEAIRDVHTLVENLFRQPDDA